LSWHGNKNGWGVAMDAERGFAVVAALLAVALIACLLLVVCGALAIPKATPAVHVNLADVELPDYLRYAPLLLAERLMPPAGEKTELPGVGTLVWGTHAEDKHGWDAMRARAATIAGGADAFWRCKDPLTGKVKWYAINQILERQGDTIKSLWSLSVFVERNGEFIEVTSFLTDQAGIKTVIERDGCNNPWRMVHP